MTKTTIDAQVSPTRHLGVLSKMEVNRLLDQSRGSVFRLYRQCSLAVLNYGDTSDNAQEVMDRYEKFDIQVTSKERGIKLNVTNAPATAFVDGTMIKGVNEHLFSVLRDIVFSNDSIIENSKFDLSKSDDTTDAVFHILRNADVLRPEIDPQLSCLLGWSLDFSPRVRLHERCRLSARFARTGYLYGLWPRCNERPNERREYWTRKAAYYDWPIPWFD